MASRKSISRRQRYAQDPEYRESVLARSRRYRATHKEKLRAYERQRRYGLSDADYEAMLARQGGVCGSCKRKPERRLQTDHCHSTGRVRGLLCLNCNSMLGMANDDPDRLQAGIEYLKATGSAAGSG